MVILFTSFCVFVCFICEWSLLFVSLLNTLLSFANLRLGKLGELVLMVEEKFGMECLQRALKPVLPSEDDFPYTVHVDSTIT